MGINNENLYFNNLMRKRNKNPILISLLKQ